MMNVGIDGHVCGQQRHNRGNSLNAKRHGKFQRQPIPVRHISRERRLHRQQARGKRQETRGKYN